MEFNLLRSEIKKAAKAADRCLQTNGCTVHSAYVRNKYDLFSDGRLYYVVEVEICLPNGERAALDCRIDIPMFDRRKSHAVASR